MGKVYERIDERWRKFIAAQPVYFVATAPSDPAGHVNVSPKGYPDTFAVLGDRTVAYLDLDGSGVETLAHVRQNGRITIMFCSFARAAKILRLYGRARVVLPADPGWAELLGHFGPHAGVRSIMVVDVERIQDSCGWSVPLAGEMRDRDVLDRYAERADARGKRAQRASADRHSIDGVLALAAQESDPASLRS